MGRRSRLFCLAILTIAFFPLKSADSQTLQFLWKKDFSKNVSWYARTSPGIILARTGNSLTALNAADGRELWAYSDISTKYWNMGGVSAMSAMSERGRNVLEVPWMGVLILNRLKLRNDAEPRLAAVNLLNGDRLWATSQVDDLMTALPLYDSGGVIIVSRRLQKKVLAAEMALESGMQFPFFLDPFLFPYPYRFEIERHDLATGKLQWSVEYPRTFTPGPTVVEALGGNVYIYFGNRILACLAGASGKVLWEDGLKHLGSSSLPLPLNLADGRLIYFSGTIKAVDPATGKQAWTIEKLGKVTGIFVHDDLAVALGENHIAAVSTANGSERWRFRTHGHTTNLIWDRATDTLLYADWKGLHRIQRTTGQSLLEAPLKLDEPPYFLRIAGPDTLLGLSFQSTYGLSAKTGQVLFTEAKLNALFTSNPVLDVWPQPEEGQVLTPLTSVPSGDAEWAGVLQHSLLSSATLNRLREFADGELLPLDVYQTEAEDGAQKTWWIDPQNDQQRIIRPAAKQHDVDRSLGNVFAVNGKTLWAADIEIK
ncbi:MAG TPA: PQQ-binding-like beta-propeller repeat protein [Candidatus Acidoferrum sp.]|nr:PQQ-binding-like beta-propeller repeat protein [Candidatus Acidoferrum sp.]